MAAYQALSITVAEDNVNMRNLLCKLLRVLGVDDIHQACDGAQAMSHLQQHSTDLLITDCNMAPTDGIELARWVRLSSESPDSYLPILMVSSLSEPHQLKRAIDAGVNHFLPKPIQPRGLLLALSQVVHDPRPFIRTEDYFGPDRRQLGSQGCPPSLERRRRDLVPSFPSHDHLDELSHHSQLS